jgi:hypothetical protein
MQPSQTPARASKASTRIGVRSVGLWLLVPALASSACQGRDPPTEIRIELPDVIESNDPVAVVVRATNAQGVSSNATDGVEYAVEPQGLATVSSGRLLRCERSGDGKISVTIAGVSRSLPLRCRIVDHIEAKDLGRVELSSPPFPPNVRAFDQAGAELGDVSVALSSKNAGVAYPKDGLLVPKSVGTANLTARAGQVAADFKVDIVRKVVAEALPIDGNTRIYLALDPGKYELKVTLKSPKRVTVEWRGAPYCNASSQGLEHVSTCALREQAGGGVVFDSPNYLDDGSKKISLVGVELYEVP